MRTLRITPYKARRTGPRSGTMIVNVPQAYVQAHGVEFGDDAFAFEDNEGRLVFEFHRPAEKEE